jgi:hypothetical protein
MAYVREHTNNLSQPEEIPLLHISWQERGTPARDVGSEEPVDWDRRASPRLWLDFAQFGGVRLHVAQCASGR